MPRRSYHPPYGYVPHPSNKNLLVADEYQQSVIRVILEKHLLGWGYTKIAGYLNLHGYKPQRAEEWGKKVVWKIIKRESGQ